MAVVQTAEQREDSSSRLVPFKFLSTPPPRFITPSFSPFSLEIKVSSCLCTSLRFPAPLANYSICLLQNHFTPFPAHAWGPNITLSFPVSAPLAVQWQHRHVWEWLFLAVKKGTSFTTYPASYELGFTAGLGLHWLRAWNWPCGLETHLGH